MSASDWIETRLRKREGGRPRRPLARVENAAAVAAEGREVFKTSGSTSGLRKPIFWDHASLLLRAARGERDRVVITRLAGEAWGAVIVRECITNERRHTLARLLGIHTPNHLRLLILPADFSSRTQRMISNERSVIPHRPVHYHHLPPTVPFAVAAAHIAAIRPRIIFSFGSYADQFFRFLDASGAMIPLPRLWVYLGDSLSDEGRELAERMGTLVYNYRLGDRAVLSPDACPCGRSLPLLARLEGRRSEVVGLADGRQLSSLILEALCGAQLRRTIQAQLAQDAPGHLRWRIVPFAEVDRGALRNALIARGQQVLGAGTTLTVDFVEEIARTPAGKFVRVVGSDGSVGGGRDVTP